MTVYYTVITSLPRHDKQFKVKQTPLSRIQLDKRLHLLPEEERLWLAQLMNVLWLSWFSPKLPLQETLKCARELRICTQDRGAQNILKQLQQPFITELIEWFFDLRSVMAALRLHKIQQSPPSGPQTTWSTRWHTRLLRHWDVPDFGLQHVYPWLHEANRHLQNNEADAVEDILLTAIWQYLNRIEARHFFDFPALIIYLLRWHIVDYWSQFNETKADERIQQLVQATNIPSSQQTKEVRT